MENKYEREPWYIKLVEEFNDVCVKVDGMIQKDEEEILEFKKRNEQETKYMQESKLKEELVRVLEELSKKSNEYERVCDMFQSGLKIADSDQHRLENAKKHYQIAKELTGIRLDFSAPPNITKGYIKNIPCRLLQPFEFEGDSDALWELIHSVFAQDLVTNKENQSINQ